MVLHDFYTTGKILHGLGEMLVEDDIDDYGMFNRLHHWQYGEMFRIFGDILGFAGIAHDVMSSGKDQSSQNNTISHSEPKTEIDYLNEQLSQVPIDDFKMESI